MDDPQNEKFLRSKLKGTSRKQRFLPSSGGGRGKLMIVKYAQHILFHFPFFLSLLFSDSVFDEILDCGLR